MLDLNKKTVAHLSNQEMQQVNGGLCIKSTKKECTWHLEIKIKIDAGSGSANG
ncbi:class I lanthipeptide [Aquimarina gracilis]|uniref:Class I lanthipeptide n=1 Tax=Aquimarina gracilis TaxID=874422 RepID=A0ABU6A0E5_9FLAO|nr:class I lanthipeptide [Aquimarina gracilis]MEB3347553.1 class I lanthipeptide [Aquimarina gracilis]